MNKYPLKVGSLFTDKETNMLWIVVAETSRDGYDALDKWVFYNVEFSTSSWGLKSTLTYKSFDVHYK